PVLYVRGQDTRLFEVTDAPPGPVAEKHTIRQRRRLVAAAAALVLVLGGVGAAVYRSVQSEGATALGAGPSTSQTSDGSSAGETSTSVAGSTDPVELAVPGDTRWLDSGVRCAPGTTLDISASGTIQHDASAGSTVGPDGLTDERYHKWNVDGLPDANTAGLIGSIEETDPFFIGSGTSYDCPRDGQVMLGINDINLDGNSGELTVRIEPRPT
ncbi:MAG TPA: hypothetical protein VFN43_12005, partial [Humibacillus sp.]|nr:hypothetical protein [Humibacillus sp.]